MRFAHPSFLALAAAAALLAAFHLLRVARRRSKLPYPAADALGDAPEALAARLARWGPAALKGLALALLAAGLARPQLLSARYQALGRGIDIVLAVDASTSMAALDFAPGDRLEAAKAAALAFVRGRVQDRIGLVAFGGAPLLACPLTLDYEALSGRLSELSPGMTRVDGTAIGDALLAAAARLKDSDAKSKVIVLLTDGRSNAGAVDPATAARAASALGVRVYTIGAAKRGRSLVPVDDPARGRVLVPIDDDLDEELLAEVARLADGRYFRAEDPKALKAVYAAIDRLEKSEVKLPEAVSRADAYHFPVLAAALLLLGEALLSCTLWLRWP